MPRLEPEGSPNWAGIKVKLFKYGTRGRRFANEILASDKFSWSVVVVVVVVHLHVHSAQTTVTIQALGKSNDNDKAGAAGMDEKGGDGLGPANVRARMCQAPSPTSFQRREFLVPSFKGLTG